MTAESEPWGLSSQQATRAFAGAALLVIALGAAEAQANLQSNPATVALTATKNSTLTVTPATPTATVASITDNSNANNFTAVSHNSSRYTRRGRRSSSARASGPPWASSGPITRSSISRSSRSVPSGAR